MQPLVIFQTGNMQFALDRNCIAGIRPIPAILTQARTRILQHIIEIEGRRLLLIDLAAASNQDIEPVHPSNGKMILLTESLPLALLADNVGSTMDAGAGQGLSLDGEQIGILGGMGYGTAPV